MAKVRSFLPGKQNARIHPTEVDCFHQVILTANGQRIVQLSTMGSDMRASGPKVSQTLQLDAGAAAELVAILRQAFPGI